MDFIFWPILIPICAIVGVFAYSIVRAVSSARVRELEVRERIAMIERGLVPPPEKDPGGFDRAMERYDRIRDDFGRYGRRSPSRYRSAGVTLMGVGFGLMLLIGVAGENPSSAVGVGGFVVLIGVAFFINSLLVRYDPPPPPPRDRSSSDSPRDTGPGSYRYGRPWPIHMVVGSGIITAPGRYHL
jgi:hypothetical protein